MKDSVATVMVDLSKSEGELFFSLQKDARWGIQRARREGLCVVESDEWDLFYKMYVETMKCVGVKVERLAHVRAHADTLFLCKKDNIALAGACVEIVRGTPTLTRAASIKEYQGLQGNNLLYWSFLLWAKNEGYEKFDLGGWQINARGNLVGVNKFKERWGTVVYSEREFPFFVALSRKILRNSSFVSWLWRSMKRLCRKCTVASCL